MKPIHKVLLCLIIPALMTSCKKLIALSPPVTLTASTDVFTTDANAMAALSGIYANLFAYNFGSSTAIYGGLSSDEFTLFSSTNLFNNAYYTNALAQTGSFTAGGELWSAMFPFVYESNAAISGLGASTTVTPAIKQQLSGEAEFFRAFCYFYLVNFYGDVPLITGIDYTTNRLLARTPQEQVWQQIIADLKNAKLLLSENYLNGSLNGTDGERVRLTKWTANALLARVYLYHKDWNLSAAEADTVLNRTAVYSLSSLDSTFLRAGLGNREAIWQLPPIYTLLNTSEGQAFILPPTGPRSGSLITSPILLNAFEAGDNRKQHWLDTVSELGVTYYFPYKYKVKPGVADVSEYSTVLRLGEQYLIRAEAEAEGAPGGGSAAISDLNVIRHRAGLAPYTGDPADQAALLKAIYHERQVELFYEWGHRWLDLKRTDMLDAVMGSPGNECQAKGGVWDPNDALYPLPLYDLQADPNLKQNPGY